MTETPELSFEVTNLSCAACAGAAERALTALDGVQSARVNPATGEASVRGLPEGGAADLVEALKAAGHPARIEETALTLDGLSCAGCVARAERALSAFAGVISARVNLATGEARVSHLAGAVGPGALARAATAAGYPARRAERSRSSAAARESEAATERDTALRRSLIAAALTLPVFVIEMGGHLVPGFAAWIEATLGRTGSWGLQFVLTTLVLAWPGRAMIGAGLSRLAARAPEMNSLVTLGAGAAWGYSTVALVAPEVLPEGTRAVYFEAAAVIVTLILLGRWLEARARGRAGAAIRHLMNLQPETALVERAGATQEVPVTELAPGEVVHLRPGARVPVDGTVLSGRSFVDESMITGEPVPAEKSEGAELTGGTVNGQGALTMRATAVGEDTALARIVATVERAQAARLPVQALADRVVAVFVPVVLAVALVTVAAWLVLGPEPRLTHALVAGVSVLIIACPCAMGLATPTSIMVGTGRAAELGVLFRKGDALQRLERVRLVAFDKTGTLTEGRPELTALIPAGRRSRSEVLAAVAAVEARSEHPIARAVERAAAAEKLTLPEASEVEAIAGHGLTGRAGERSVLIGSARLMAREGLATTALDNEAEVRAAAGETVLFAALDGEIAALIAVADPVKAGAAETVAALRAEGLEVAMVTGDARATAEAVAARLGIDHVAAEVLPEDKAAAVTRLRAEHGPVAFVGDGINDAPALAAADAGLAIGTGTDIAIESADVVLVSGDPHGVVQALDISRRTMRNIRENLVWAFGYNTVLIPVAAGVLYPAFGMLLSPMLAAGAMALSSVFVVTNALRLRRVTPPRGGGAPGDAEVDDAPRRSPPAAAQG